MCYIASLDFYISLLDHSITLINEYIVLKTYRINDLLSKSQVSFLLHSLDRVIPIVFPCITSKPNHSGLLNLVVDVSLSTYVRSSAYSVFRRLHFVGVVTIGKRLTYPLSADAIPLFVLQVSRLNLCVARCKRAIPFQSFGHLST